MYLVLKIDCLLGKVRDESLLFLFFLSFFLSSFVKSYRAVSAFVFKVPFFYVVYSYDSRLCCLSNK